MVKWHNRTPQPRVFKDFSDSARRIRPFDEPEPMPDIMSLVQYSLNTTECPTLGNFSPIEVFSGQKPRSTIGLFAFTGHTFNEIKNTTIPSSVVKEHVVSLRATLQKISKRVEAKKMNKRISNKKIASR
jgi:hypothetical protein